MSVFCASAAIERVASTQQNAVSQCTCWVHRQWVPLSDDVAAVCLCLGLLFEVTPILFILDCFEFCTLSCQPLAFYTFINKMDMHVLSYSLHYTYFT